MAALHNKITWSCHRGMKELDLLLLPFVNGAFHLLNEKQKTDFEALLTLDDLTLFDCFFNQKKLEDPFLQALINLLKLYQQQHVAH